MNILGLSISRRTFIILIGIGLYLVMLVVLTSVEKSSQASNINGFQDALWYSIVTLTTVGYGDIYPVTPIGRYIGYVFVLGSLGVLGLLIRLIVLDLLH